MPETKCTGVGVSDLKGLDAGDWLAATVAGIAAGLGAAMAWFKGSKGRIYLRIDAVEEKMGTWAEMHATHDTQLAVLKACQDNINKELTEIKETTKATNIKLDAVLLAVRK